MRTSWEKILFVEATLLALVLLVASTDAFTTLASNRLLPERCYALSSSSNEEGEVVIRLNKVFKATHSRRQADVLIASGRVTVNHHPVTEKGGIMVRPHVDVVHLDGKQIDGWESLNAIPPPANENLNLDAGASINNPVAVFEYVKYWKPRGVTCTTDQRIAGNIIDEIAVDGYRPNHRVYPVGRLDKDTSGLILLTNDGRLPNAFLRSQQRKEKVYNVLVDYPLEHNDLEQLRVRR
jgi:16S rRNA U516 pseudouridylate synthase RsuA-like enzyme